MLILKSVSLKPLHGYGVLLRIRQISGEALEIPQGSLYPALYRLEHQGLMLPNGGKARTTGEPNSTPQPPLDDADYGKRRRGGTASHRQLRLR